MSSPGPDPTTTAPTPGAAAAALWARLRLVVIDLETLTHERTSRLIEVGVVTCRGGRVTSTTWSARANPGFPVDDNTFRVHGITTEELADEPTFAGCEPELTRRLRGLDGETVVLCAFNAGGDIAVLRREYRELGLELPELPVLDVARLPAVVGVRPASGSLGDLAAELGVTNPKAHSAGGDARTTADALVLLLERAAEQGWNDFEALRTKAMRGRKATTASLRGPRQLGDDYDDEDLLDFPIEHTAGHNTLLTSTSASAVSSWQDALAECAALRCSYARDRVGNAEVPAANLRDAVETVLRLLLVADADGEVDVPAVATVLGALGPLLKALPTRAKAVAWFDAWQPLLQPLGRCPTEDTVTPCPDCRQGATCPLDRWVYELAPAALGPLPAKPGQGVVKGFLHVNGKDLGKGVLTTWLGQGRQQLAEATAWWVHQQHRSSGHSVAAQTFARLAWLAGSREPRLAAAYATLLAAPGDQKALERARDVCADALQHRAGSTFDGWAELGAKHAQLEGRLSRLRIRPTDELDEDGNPIPARRHHPETPRRNRPRRFAL